MSVLRNIDLWIWYNSGVWLTVTVNLSIFLVSFVLIRISCNALHDISTTVKRRKATEEESEECEVLEVDIF